MRRPPPVAETGRSRRSPEGVEGRGHAQRASEAPEHRAAVREAKGRLGPGNLEGEARKYAGPYPRAAKGECAGETGEGGAKRKNTFPPRLLAVEAREAVRRQAIGKSRPQTAGLWAISPPGQRCSPGGFLCAFAAKNSLASRGLCGIINAKIHFPMEG